MTENTLADDRGAPPRATRDAPRKTPGRHQKILNILHKPFTAWVILCCGLLATLFAWKLSTDYLQQQIEQRFNTHVDEITTAIEKRMLVYEQLLWGGVALFNASDEVSRAEWHTYINSLKIDRHWQGIQGMGFSVPVSQSQRTAHTAALRDEGFADYDIRPAGKRNEYSAIIYLEPFDWRNRKAFGYDMWSKKLRRQAMQRARDTGKAATSGAVDLVQETDRDIQKGFLTYVPVYQNGITPKTRQQRRDLFVGWVFAPFRTGDLMQGVLGKRDAEVEFQIFDGTTQTNPHKLFDSGIDEPENARNVIGSPLHAQRELNLQGRRWTLRFESRNTPTSALERNQPNLIAACGLIVDLFLFFIIASLARAHAIQKTMSNELRDAKTHLEYKVKCRTLALNEERLRLEERVAERTTQLREKVSESEALVNALTDINENLRQFSYVASHDLKEPLRMVVSFTDLLAQKYADKLDDTGREYIKIAADSGMRMQTMIDDLLQFTRLDDNSERIKKVDCNVELVHVLQDYQDAISSDQIEVIRADLPTIRCNPSRFLTVIKNLIGNGIKYGKAEGITTIRVGAQEKNDEWIFSVADNGIGIEERFHQRIFEPFKRLHSHDEYAGTGLGLAICKKIVVTWGGRIWLDSLPGVGTTFHFSMPKRLAVPPPSELAVATMA